MNKLKSWYMKTYGSYFTGVFKYVYFVCLLCAVIFMSVVFLVVAGLVANKVHKEYGLKRFASRLESIEQYNDADIVDTYKGTWGDGGSAGDEYIVAAVLLKTDGESYNPIHISKYYSSLKISTKECGSLNILELHVVLNPLDNVNYYTELGLFPSEKAFPNASELINDDDHVYFSVYAYCPDIHQVESF